MASVAAVSPTSTTNAHHITLEPADGTGTRYGLVLSPNSNAINRRPRQGSNYVPFTQNDWSGGRGLKLATDDRSRFADSKRLNTRRSGQVTLGGLETYTTGHRVAEQFMPANAAGLTWQALTGADRFIAYKVTIPTGAAGNRARIYFWVRRRGTPGTFSARLKNNNVSDPGTEAKLVQITTSNIDDTISLLYEFTFSSVQAVTVAQIYWVEASGAAGDDATNHWEVGTDAARTNALTKASPSGADGSWVNPTYDLFFRLVDDTDIAGAMFFTYKSQFYMLTRPTATAAPKLYINGYRGVATGAGQSRTVLQDTTQNWPVNSLAGKLALIIDGANSEWQQPYKTILSNTANTFTTDAFGKAHVAGETVYAILGTDTWTEITGHGLTVLPTSIAATDDICYFAQGDKTKMRRMREYINNAVWTREFAEENNYASLLKAYKSQTSGLMISKVNQAGNNGEPSLAHAKPVPWGSVLRLGFPYLLDDCEVTTGWTFGANVTGSTDNAFFMTKTKSVKMVKAAGSSTTNPFAYHGFTAGSINAYKGRIVRFWLASSVALTAGQLKLRLSQATDCSTSVQDINVPETPANDWVQISLPYTDTSGGVWALSSFGFISTINATFWVDGIELVPAGSEVPLGKGGGRVNGIELYGEPEVPWVLRAGEVGSVENGVYTPIPLREYTQVENVHNGMGHIVHDVYLYFSFLQGLEEYYKSNLDDVGPNKEEGLPENRQGYITSMVGYPDRFLANIDGGTGGYSSIMSRKGGGWHEDYRCDAAGKRIRSIFHQVIPGDMADRLWFCEGEDVAYLPMPGNTVNELTDSTYLFTHEGVLVLARIGDDQQRLFSSVKLGLENVSAARCIEWDYKLDDAATWTPMTTKFTSGPVQKLTLPNGGVTGKRLDLRFRLQSNDKTQTPRITSINVSTTEQGDVRYSYSMTFIYSDNGRDLLNNAENYTRAETLIAQLDTWAANKTALTMHSISEVYDNKIVFLDPTPVGPVANVMETQQEKQQGTLTATEPE